MYVVEALRYGNREAHSYVVGVYSNLRSAAVASLAEEYWRGGKYECYINQYTVDELEAKKESFLMTNCIGDDTKKLEEDINFIIKRSKSEILEK